MKNLFSEAEINEVFRALNILTESQRQSVLIPLQNVRQVQSASEFRFDIGFNAKMPAR